MNQTVDVDIYKTFIELKPYVRGLSPALERKLSIYSYTERKITMEAFKINNDSIRIPKGFLLKNIKELLEIDGIYVDKINDYSDELRCNRSIDISMRPGKGANDDHQKDSIMFMIDKNAYKTQKFLNNDTGYGKTFCSIKTISILGLPTMIILNKESLMKQWRNEIKKFTFVKDSEIYDIKGRNSIDKLYKNNTKYKIYLCATQTLELLAIDNELQNFIENNNIGIKIIDEAHEMMKAVFTIDLSCNVDYNYYLSATPERSDVNERILYSKLIKGFDRFGDYTAFLKKYIHVKNVLINTFPKQYVKYVCKTKNGFSSIIYENFIFKNNRNKLYFFLICKYIVDRMLKNDKESRILIVMNTKNNINEIVNMFKKENIKCGVFTSDLDGESKQKELYKNVILSTIKSSGSGLNIKNLRVIINFVQFKSNVLLHQLFGRLRYIDGKALFFFNIVDEGFEDIVRQNVYRQSFFSKKSKDVSDIKLEFEELTREFFNKK